MRALIAMRSERRARRERIGRAEFFVAEAGESGKRVFEAQRVSVSFDDYVVIRDLDLKIQRGDRVGIVGPNGAGKSTLLKLLLGELEPSTGKVVRGTRLEAAYYDQQRARLDLSASVQDNVNDGNTFVPIGGENRHVSGYLRDFLFRPDQLRTPASALSGGERNRLLLAKLFARPVNLLVLDEPTNDLDLDTLELLEERIADFDGTLLLVSHDRAFLDRVVTSLLVLEGDGRVQEFIGGWTDYANWRALRQRNAAPPRETTSSRESSPAAVRAKDSTPSRSRRLTFKEQREFDSLPATIESLETDKSELERAVADPAFYQRPQDEVRSALTRLQSLGAEIDAGYTRWAELESLRG